MKIVFAGTPANAARTLEALFQSGHEIVSVLTRPDAIVGRKRELTQSAVALVAQQLNLPVIKANRVDDEVLQRIVASGAQLGVVVAFGSLLKPSALEALEFGWVNLHYSLLPKYRGASPVQSALIRGERETGVTLFQLDEGMDTGEIIGKVETEIQPGENSGELLGRLSELGTTLLLQELPRIESGFASKVPQPVGQYPEAQKINRSMASIDWSKSAIEIENLIRGLNPEPMAFTSISGVPIRVLEARALGATDWASLDEQPSDNQQIGSIKLIDKKILVRAGSGTLLEIKQVQPAGKRPMAASDWYRGNPQGRFDVTE